VILDSSALVSMLLKEHGYSEIVVAIARADYVGVGTPTLAETEIVLRARKVKNAALILGALLKSLDAVEIPFTEQHWSIAGAAFARFGKGTGHKAGLNFGDCLTYAIAKHANLPLLFVGNDFVHTDIQSVR
jgi:ribonuclease VapC